MNDFVKEVGENNKAHGFRDAEIKPTDFVALIHSEVSEILEEFRDGREATETYVENHEEDLPMFCQYEEDRGFGFWRDYYDGDTLGFIDSEFQTNEELGYEKVTAWMPLPEPYRESEGV